MLVPDPRPVTSAADTTHPVARAFAGAALAAAPVTLLAARLGAPLPPCPFKALTGIECPGCGTGRAITALSRGDIPAMLDHNLLLPILGPLLVLSLLGVLFNRTPLLARRGWALPMLLLLTGFWALRLLPFEALAYLDSSAN
jgi:hypothetical protein